MRTHAARATRVLGESLETYRSVVAALAEGALVAIPGVANYSVIVDARNDDAVQRLYRVKNRPASKPITLMMPPHDVADWIDVHPACRGALCLLGEPIVLVGTMRTGARLSPRVNAGTSKLGVFWLNTLLHKMVYHSTTVATPLVVAGSSLNLSGQPMVTTIADAMAQFDGVLDMIVDGGDCSSPGTHASVLDVSGRAPRLLRDGVVSRQTLRAMFPSLMITETSPFD
jgi:L-threonylcarbamoyladenylate synthase